MDINYKVSLYKAKTMARFNKNKNKGNIILYISNIWNIDKNKLLSFNHFVEWCIYFTLVERICLERAHNKIKIKGGKCKPCCVEEIAFHIYIGI